MVSRKLMATWAVFDFSLLAAGGLSIAFSIIWRKPDVLMNMIVSPMYLNGGMALGILLLISFLVSIGAVVQRNHITVGFEILNWLLVVDVLGITTIGTMDWWFTLKERDNFHQEWLKQSEANRIVLQDKYQCCGYFNTTDSAVVGGSFCTSQQFISGLNATADMCVTGITHDADYTLNNVFTVIYGFMAIALGLFLASLCVIKQRQEDERFKKIDAKRGGRGFV